MAALLVYCDLLPDPSVICATRSVAQLLDEMDAMRTTTRTVTKCAMSNCENRGTHNQDSVRLCSHHARTWKHPEKAIWTWIMPSSWAIVTSTTMSNAVLIHGSDRNWTTL